MTPLQKLPRNVEDLGKLIVAKGFKKLPKVQKIAKSGHTGGDQESPCPKHLQPFIKQRIKYILVEKHPGNCHLTICLFQAHQLHLQPDPCRFYLPITIHGHQIWVAKDSNLY